MITINLTDIRGLNIMDNPLAQRDGALINAVNVESYPAGAKSKRPGYVTFNDSFGTSVQSLFSWTKGDGSLFLYAKTPTQLYYSLNGTGAWTSAGNGAMGGTNPVGYAILNDTLTICDGIGSTRYTTNGTSFTDTTLAPVAVDACMYQNRIYLAGTASTLFYSSAGDATNWSTSGTSDSSSFEIPGAGKLLKTFTSADRLIATKTSGLMYKWDGYSLVDMTTKLGPSSYNGIASQEGYYFWLNDLGIFGYGGVRPELISNPIQPMIYNNANTGIAGSQLSIAPAECHRYVYSVGVGSITDDITRYTVNNAIIRYDYQKNELLTWSFADNPKAFHSYKDASGNKQLMFVDSTGQCYKMDGTATTDNGDAIETRMEFVITGNAPDNDKKWRWLNLYFNPGSQAKCQVACADTYVKDSKNWIEIGDAPSGLLEWRFPPDARSKLLFVRIYESSKDTRFTFYGATVTADMVNK